MKISCLAEGLATANIGETANSKLEVELLTPMDGSETLELIEEGREYLAQSVPW